MALMGSGRFAHQRLACGELLGVDAILHEELTVLAALGLKLDLTVPFKVGGQLGLTCGLRTKA